MKKIGVILSGCGVYDGSEIHEAVLTLLAIDEAGAESVCFAPDIDQHHVVNHLTGEEMNERRNCLVESARIARGKVSPLSSLNVKDLDALIVPGGFGAAKNLTKWAFSGAEGTILPEVKQAILEMVKAKKPVGAVCMGPAVLAKALQGSGIRAMLTVGTTSQSSPYDIEAVSAGLNQTGANAVMRSVAEIAIDPENKIVTAPCYMMDASISQIRENISQVVSEVLSMC